MSRLRRLDIFEAPSPIFFTETSIFTPPTPTFPSFAEMELGFAALDLLTPTPTPFDFDTITDLIQIEKTPLSYKRYQVLEKKNEAPLMKVKLTSLCDRVAALESGFEKIAKEKEKKKKKKELDRKYSWTAEIKSTEKDGVDKKYKWKTEIKGGKQEEKSYEYVAEFKGKGKDSSIDRRYIYKASSNNLAKKVILDRKEETLAQKKGEKTRAKARVVEIVEEDEEQVDQGAIVLKQAFARRAGGGGNNGKGKRKELSPQDAAILIQMSFKAYLIRRSKLLRALRDLAVAKAKLKEIRASFNNFSYRRLIDRDAEERQKFTERIIVLLLTVDAIEGVDLTVRTARRSIIDELEAMLDVVDPQPNGKLGSMKRRTFDMPDGTIQKEIAAGVAEVVQMLERDEKNGHVNEDFIF